MLLTFGLGLALECGGGGARPPGLVDGANDDAELELATLDRDSDRSVPSRTEMSGVDSIEVGTPADSCNTGQLVNHPKGKEVRGP